MKKDPAGHDPGDIVETSRADWNPRALLVDKKMDEPGKRLFLIKMKNFFPGSHVLFNA